jgi:hypothetical protein
MTAQSGMVDLSGLTPKERLRCWIVARLLGDDPSPVVLEALSKDGGSVLKGVVGTIEGIVIDPPPVDRDN